MAVISQISPDEKKVTIKVSGNFDFSAHRAFREAYTSVTSPGVRYDLDLAGTSYIDSSALGMLLLLREHAGGDKSDVRIVNFTPEVGRILTIANFHKLFKFDVERP